jgi:hypothetical protein
MLSTPLPSDWWTNGLIHPGADTVSKPQYRSGWPELTLTLKVTFIVTKEHIPVKTVWSRRRPQPLKSADATESLSAQRLRSTATRQRLVISTLVLVPAAAAIGMAPVAVAEPPTCTDGQTPGNGNCINGTPPSGGGISGLVPNGAPDVYGPMAPSAGTPPASCGQTPGNGNCNNGIPPSGGGISGLVPNGAPDVYGPMAPSAGTPPAS